MYNKSTKLLIACENNDEYQIMNYLKNIKGKIPKKIVQLCFIKLCSKGNIDSIKLFTQHISQKNLFFPSLTGFTYKFDNITYICAFENALVNNNVNVAINLKNSLDNSINNCIYTIHKKCCLNVALDSIAYLNDNYENLINVSLIKECCELDLLKSVQLLISIYNVNDKIQQLFLHSCINNSLNTVKWFFFTHNCTVNTTNFREIIVQCTSTQILDYLKIVQNIIFSVNYVEELIKYVINNNAIMLNDKVNWLLNLVDDNTKQKIIDWLLIYLFCEHDDPQNMDTLSFYNIDKCIIEKIYFYACATGNINSAKKLQSKYNINIRKHNDTEFLLLATIFLDDMDQYNNILNKYSDLNYELIKNKTKKYNVKKTLRWLQSICQDYCLFNNEISVTTLFEKAQCCYANKNIDKSIDILQIKHVNLQDTCNEECLYCLETCKKLIKMNCGHFMCIQSMFIWFNKNKYYSCPTCSKMIIFPECIIIN